jgi:phage repressor protein C with HTH and peptisase S24 domain
MSVSERIREVAKVKSLSLKDLSEATDTSYRTLQNYISGERGVGADFLSALSEHLGVSATWILTGIPPMFLSAMHPNEGMENPTTLPVPQPQPDFIQVPRLSLEASAGPGALVDNELQTGFYAFNRKWLARRHLSPENLSVIAVRGDSMEPRLSDGDLILVDRAQKRIADGIAYVLRIDTDLLVKNVQRVRPGVIALLSANALYPPREIETGSLEDASPKAEVEIIGRVVASMHEW